MPLDAERVGQGQDCGRAVAVPDVDRFAREGGTLGNIPDIAFEQHRLRGADRILGDVRKAEFRAGAEVGLHGALAVGRNEHVAARGRSAVRGPGQADVDSQRLHVVIEYAPELVVPDLAYISARAPEIGEAGDRVGHGSARHLRGRAHHVVDLPGPVLVD